MSDNELIAEFMGLERREADSSYNKARYYRPATDKRRRGEFVAYYDSFLYHESWDRLMPVVEKIARECSYDVYITADGFGRNHQCVIGTTTQIYSESESSWLLESVYTAVVKFIKWHNANQQPKP